MRILVYSFYFPPHGGPGSLRPVKLLKYMSENNLQGTIVSCSLEDYSIFDKSLMSEIPQNFDIIRTPRKANPFRFIKNSASSGIHSPRSDYLFLPDNKIWWVRKAVEMGIRAEPHADLVWATCPPFSAAIAAKNAAVRLDVPLALDFRDSWLKNPNRPRLTAIHRAINRKKARECVQRASLVTCVYDAIRNEVRELTQNSKIELIPNGYDPQDFENIHTATHSENHLKIFYLGTLYSSFNYPLPILRAMAELKNITLEIVGRYSDRLLEDTKKLGIEDRIILNDFMPHRDALKKAAQADVMLLFVDKRLYSDGQITSKAYEYIGLGKPIIACVPIGGEADILMRNIDNAVTIDTDDESTIIEVLRKFSLKKETRNLQNITPSQKYSRKVHAQKLWDLFREIAPE